ncbi:DUF6730 family protein [Croceivirga radicis]|uniref:DUF6730 family protein n=1 Tax=Croceivirga radicis TaxID=1929488 RepID=UPI000255B3E1|nr:DUF6730 family protein [Croceivirga radicis]
MSKLEIISDIIVNHLNRFEKNRQKFADDLERLEKTQIKFETEKARKLLIDMDVVFLKEEHKRNDFLNRLNSTLERAKIYPNWAIKTFVIMVVILVI